MKNSLMKTRVKGKLKIATPNLQKSPNEKVYQRDERGEGDKRKPSLSGPSFSFAACGKTLLGVLASEAKQSDS